MVIHRLELKVQAVSQGLMFKEKAAVTDREEYLFPKVKIWHLVWSPDSRSA